VQQAQASQVSLIPTWTAAEEMDLPRIHPHAHLVFSAQGASKNQGKKEKR
jgi:hypothetical protein